MRRILAPAVRCAAAVGLALACAAPLSAQRFSTESHRGLDLEIGFFSYGRDRYAEDFEVGVHGAVGYRIQRRELFVEPHVRLMVPMSGAPNFCADPGVCGPREASALDEIPTFWPALSVGLVLGEAFYSQAMVLRAALGVGDELQPLVGARYEGSARWFGWFVEANAERIRWGSSEADARKRWKPALVVGARVWLRPVDVPAPGGSTDAGILANPAVEDDTTNAADPSADPER